MEEDVEAKLTADQIRRVAYAADRELRIVRGEYSVKQWIDLKDQERVGWRIPADADALRVALNSDVTMRLAGK